MLSKSGDHLWPLFFVDAKRGYRTEQGKAGKKISKGKRITPLPFVNATLDCYCNQLCLLPNVLRFVCEDNLITNVGFNSEMIRKILR